MEDTGVVLVCEEADSLDNVGELDVMANSDEDNNKDMAFSVKDPQELLIELPEVGDGAATESPSVEHILLKEGGEVADSNDQREVGEELQADLSGGQSIQLPDGTVAVIQNITPCKFPTGSLQMVNLEDGTVAWLATGMFAADDSLSAEQLGLDSIDVQVDDVMMDEENKASVIAELASSGIECQTSDTAASLMSADGSVLMNHMSMPPAPVYSTDRTFTCSYEGCQRFYTTLHHLKVHQRSHTGDRPFQCDFDGCNKAFATGYALKSHRRIHTGEKPYICSSVNCNKAFKTSGDLQKHTRTHTGEKPFTCPFPGCDRSFTTSNIRKVHIRTHTGERPYSCDEPGCGKTFASATNYKNHIRIHSGEKPYICTSEGCGKRFTEYSSLYKHHVVHTHQKPYVCTDCGKTYRQTSTLSMHRRMAHCDCSVDMSSAGGPQQTFVLSNTFFPLSGDESTINQKSIISLRFVEDGLRSADETDGNLVIDTSDSHQALLAAGDGVSVTAANDPSTVDRTTSETSTLLPTSAAYEELSSPASVTLHRDAKSGVYVLTDKSQFTVLQRIAEQQPQPQQ